MDRRPPIVDFFGEDAGHELFFRAISRRLTKELGLPALEIRTRSSRGGHGHAISQLRASFKVPIGPPGDLLVVLIDANGDGWAQRRAEIEPEVEASPYPRSVIGCPEPEIEAWLTADPKALKKSLDVTLLPAGTGLVDHKARLSLSLREAGIAVLSDVMEIAHEVVPEIDLYRAGKESASLRHFVDGLRDSYTFLRDHGTHDR